MSDVSRRSLIAALGMLATSPSLGWAAPSASQIYSRRLADGVLLITGVGCNVLAVRGRRGVTLVDTGSEEYFRALLAAVEGEWQQAPVAAVNTHWHPENTGGNAVLAALGVHVYAHENTRLWMSTRFVVPGTTRRVEPRPREMWPTRTFLDTALVEEDGQRLELRHLPQAHTDGDIVVRLRDPDLIAAGDLVSVGMYPVMDVSTGGWIGGLVQSTAALLEMAGPRTLIVPSQGPVVGRDHLVEQHRLLSTLYERLLGLLKKGMSAKEMLAAGVTRDFDDRWGDPTRFVLDAYPGLWGHQNEFDGIT